MVPVSVLIPIVEVAMDVVEKRRKKENPPSSSQPPSPAQPHIQRNLTNRTYTYVFLPRIPHPIQSQSLTLTPKNPIDPNP